MERFEQRNGGKQRFSEVLPGYENLDTLAAVLQPHVLGSVSCSLWHWYRADCKLLVPRRKWPRNMVGMMLFKESTPTRSKLQLGMHGVVRLVVLPALGLLEHWPRQKM